MFTIGYNKYVIENKKEIEKMFGEFEVYASPEQFREYKNFSKINLLFNLIADKGEFVNNYKKNLKIVEEIKPDIITSSSYFFGAYLARLGYKVEASIVNQIDTIEKVSEINDLGYYGLTIPSFKNYDFEFIDKIKKFFPNLRIKVIPNMICPLCIIYAEEHEFFSRMSSGKKINFKETDKMLLNCRIEEKTTVLRNSIIIPSNFKMYKDITFKIASRLGHIEPFMEFLKSIKNEDDEKYLTILCNFFFSYVYDCKDFAKMFLKYKINCKFNCYECDYCKKFDFVHKSLLKKNLDNYYKDNSFWKNQH